MPPGFPLVRRHPFPDRFVRLVHAIVRAAVDGDGGLTSWRFGRVHLAGSLKRTRDLHTEIAQYRRAGLCRVVVEKNVVSVGPQAWLAANERPDLVERGPPGRADTARRDLAPHRGQLAGMNSLYVDGNGH